MSNAGLARRGEPQKSQGLAPLSKHKTHAAALQVTVAALRNQGPGHSIRHVRLGSRIAWGYSAYSPESRNVTRTCTPLSEHGDFSAQKAWTPLTASTENALKDFIKNHARCTAQDLVAVVEKHQEERPSDSWLGTFLKNHRKLNAARLVRLSKCKWIQSDWAQLQRQYGKMEDLLQRPPAEWPSLLKVGDCSFDPRKHVLHSATQRFSMRLSPGKQGVHQVMW